MASSMTTHTHRLFFLLLLALSSPCCLPQNLAKADDQLINQECHNSKAPATCLSCVKSDPGSLEADVVGIAAIVVKCMNRRSAVLAANMSELITGTPDRTLKTAFLGCSRGYSGAVEILERVVGTYLQHGDFDRANKCIRRAAQSQVACREDIDDKKFEFPRDVAYGMQVFDDLTDAATRIIGRL